MAGPDLHFQETFWLGWEGWLVGSRMEAREQSTLARWGCARLLHMGECRSGSPAPSAKLPGQPPRLSEKEANSEMCGLHQEISVGRGDRDNNRPGAGDLGRCLGPPLSLSWDAFPHPATSPGSPEQASPGAGLVGAWSRQLYFKIRAQASK